MPNYQLLNDKTHKNLKVITGHSAQFDENIANTLTFPTEYGDVQREYPIFFGKNPDTGEFCSIVVFGFQAGENLFLQGEQWNASYIPAAIARGPFLIGFQNQQENGGSPAAPVIQVDMDSPRISQTEGEAMFLADGSISPYAKKINSILSAIHQGMEASKSMFAAFLEYDLIEPVTLNIELNSGQKINLQGNYTIHEEKLSKLSGEALEKLNKAGYLQAAFLVIASLNNIKKLIEMKNKPNDSANN